MKTIMFTAFVFLLLTGCKPVQFSFQQSQLNKTYIQDLLTLADQPATISNGKIYVAELVEDYTNRDGIGEKTIINRESKKETLGIPLLDKSFKLFIITAAQGENKHCIFIPAIFNSTNQCMGLGPALIGNYGAGEILFFKRMVYYPVKKKGKTGWTYSKKECEFKKSNSIFDPMDRSKTKINIAFQTFEDEDLTELSSFRIARIVQLNDNRFGGNKALIYDIASVFEDTDALRFTFLQNL